MPKKVATTIYITEDQQRMLKQLNLRTKVPVAEYIRQGIDVILQKYKDFLPGQMDLNSLFSDSIDESASNEQQLPGQKTRTGSSKFDTT